MSYLRDYAKIARLYLQKGNWNGKQVNGSTRIKHSIRPDFNNSCYQNQWYSQKSQKYYKDSSDKYMLLTISDSLSAIADIDEIKYKRPIRRWNNKQKWIIQTCGPQFFALGIIGQELYVYPENEMILIRLGKKRDIRFSNIFSLIQGSLNKYERGD